MLEKVTLSTLSCHWYAAPETSEVIIMDEDAGHAATTTAAAFTGMLFSVSCVATELVIEA